jgi:hypothetical protein
MDSDCSRDKGPDHCAPGESDWLEPKALHVGDDMLDVGRGGRREREDWLPWPVCFLLRLFAVRAIQHYERRRASQFYLKIVEGNLEKWKLA